MTSKKHKHVSPKKRHRSHKKSDKEVFSKWTVYILSILVTLIIITNLSFSALEVMNWDNRLLSVLILPSLMKVFGVLVIVYSPWVWFTRNKIKNDYTDFRKTLVSFFK